MKNEKETGDDDRFEYAIEDLEDWERDFLDAFRRESDAYLEDLEQEENLCTPEFLARMDKLFQDHKEAELRRLRRNPFYRLRNAWQKWKQQADGMKK